MYHQDTKERYYQIAQRQWILWTNRFCPLLAQWAGGAYWKHFEEIQLSIYTQAVREAGPNLWALDEIKYI